MNAIVANIRGLDTEVLFVIDVVLRLLEKRFVVNVWDI